MIRDITISALGLLGAGLLAAGLWQVSPAVCKIVMGAIALSIAAVAGLAGRGRTK